MSLDDQEIICSCREYIRLKKGNIVPDMKILLEKGGKIYSLERDLCVSKKFYQSGKLEKNSLLLEIDTDNVKDCSYKNN